MELYVGAVGIIAGVFVVIFGGRGLIDLVRERVRVRPELALTRLQLAELLLDHYPDERAGAIELLDTAIAEFREMKMAPSLEKALTLRERLN